MEQNSHRRVLAIHDLSGFSQTSLMAIIPILNSAGIAVCALPTAVLSSNTEQPGFQMVDMTPYLTGFTNQWQQLGLSFTAIYSGFLGSELQVSLVLQTLDKFRTESTLVIVDPVMGDDGNLYPCFDAGIVPAMLKLVVQADVVTPNITEAALLLNQKYAPDISIHTVKAWCKSLSELGPQYVCITSVPVRGKPDTTSVIAYNRRTSGFYKCTCPYLPVIYPGTGDIFTAVLTANMLNGLSFEKAVHRAVRFVYKAIGITMQAQTPPAEGIRLEKALRYL
jgi:pyridoxine kinase